MEIVIVGAGALGRLLGAYLSRGGNEIVYIETDPDVVAAINEKGIGVVSPDCQGTQLLDYYPAYAVANGREIQQCDLLFMTVKSYATRAATQQIAHLVGSNSPVITLQNGLGHLEIMEKICAPADIVPGCTSLAGTALGPGQVLNDGIGTTYLGYRQGTGSGQLAKISEVLNDSGVPVEEVPDIISRVWSRVVVHAAINPVSAILRCRNSELLQNMHSLSLMKRLVDEGRDIAAARGIDLGDADHYEMLFASCRNRAGHLSPMLQDIINSRKTEVDALNGILCRYARKTGVSADSHLTVYELIKSLEKQGETLELSKRGGENG